VVFATFLKKDNNNITQVNVKRFNASTNDWQDVGPQPVSASHASVNNVALTITPDNKLFLVFRDFTLGIYAKTFDIANILPVTLTTFTASQQNNKSLLEWHVENEVNNKQFEVEHSTDAITFTKIGEVPARLPAGDAHDYSFLHGNPEEGINYYRLKQVDIDERFTYSKIINITFSSELRPLIVLFPNPVREVLHTEFSTVGKKEIIIRNLEGKVIKHVISSEISLDINVANLPSGTYFLSLYGNNLIDTRTFIK
jgi:hypothetical protein